MFPFTENNSYDHFRRHFDSVWWRAAHGAEAGDFYWHYRADTASAASSYGLFGEPELDDEADGAGE